MTLRCDFTVFMYTIEKNRDMPRSLYAGRETETFKFAHVLLEDCPHSPLHRLNIEDIRLPFQAAACLHSEPAKGTLEDRPHSTPCGG